MNIPSVIAVSGLQKCYGRRVAVDGVSFTVGRGEVVGLVGPNGAGKSTILALLAGLIRPTAGDIRIAGRSVVRQPRLTAAAVGYVPQDLALYPALTVLDNLRFWSRMAGLSRAVTEDRIRTVAGVTGLGPHLRAPVRTLSGGMKRRLHVGVALLHDPPILIMDEPTVGLDIQSVRDITGFIKAQAAAGKAVIYSTHNAAEIERLCDRVILLNRGRVVFSGPVHHLVQAAVEGGAAGHSGLPRLDDILASVGDWQGADPKPTWRKG